MSHCNSYLQTRVANIDSVPLPFGARTSQWRQLKRAVLHVQWGKRGRNLARTKNFCDSRQPNKTTKTRWNSLLRCWRNRFPFPFPFPKFSEWKCSWLVLSLVSLSWRIRRWVWRDSHYVPRRSQKAFRPELRVIQRRNGIIPRRREVARVCWASRAWVLRLDFLHRTM